MMHFEGERLLPLPVEQLLAKLGDAEFLVNCIPDGEVTGTPSRHQATCTVRPGFAFVRGTLDVTIDLLEASEANTLRFLQTSKGIGTSSEVETCVTLSRADGGTRLKWKAEVKRLGGLLKAIPSGLIRGAAHKVIEDVWRGVEEKLVPPESHQG